MNSDLYKYLPDAAELMIDMDIPNYRTVDSEDVLEVCLGRVMDVFDELEDVDVTLELKEQAAFASGQEFLHKLARRETEVIAQYLATVVQQAGKPLLVLVKIPEPNQGDRRG